MRILLVILSFFLLTGCNSEEKLSIIPQAPLDGYIVKVKSDVFLVTSPSPRKINEDKNMYDAIWVTHEKSDFTPKLGEHVVVTLKGAGVFTYPGHGMAKEITVVDGPQKFTDATITEIDVISRALSKLRDDISVPVIRNINFDKAKEIWTIEIINGTNHSQSQIIEIKDNRKSIGEAPGSSTAMQLRIPFFVEVMSRFLSPTTIQYPATRIHYIIWMIA